MIEIAEIVEIVSGTGFPIAVAVYLLYERDRTTKAMTGLLTEIKTMFETMLQERR